MTFVQIVELFDAFVPCQQTLLRTPTMTGPTCTVSTSTITPVTRRLRPRRFLVAALALAMVQCLAASQAAAQIPSWEQVEKTFRKHYADPKSPQGLAQGPPLVTYNTARRIFYELWEQRWNVSDQTEILKLCPPDSSFLAQQCLSPAGQKFLKQAADPATIFDRLERFAALPQGQQKIRDLLQGPPGHHDMLNYMLGSSGSKLLFEGAVADPNARDFNKPTGKIYSPEQLLERIKKSHAYDVEVEQRRWHRK